MTVEEPRSNTPATYPILTPTLLTDLMTRRQTTDFGAKLKRCFKTPRMKESGILRLRRGGEGSQHYVPWYLCSRTYVPRYLCSPVPICSRTYVPRYLCSPIHNMFPGTYVPRTYMFPGTYVPEPMFPGTYVLRYLCSPVHMFPGKYTYMFPEPMFPEPMFPGPYVSRFIIKVLFIHTVIFLTSRRIVLLGMVFV